MLELTIHTREGQTVRAQGSGDSSLMEAIRDSGVDELRALCGGALSCATCHIYVAPEFIGSLPPMTADENELLESSNYRTPNSRLSCQIPCASAPPGLVVTIAPDDD